MRRLAPALCIVVCLAGGSAALAQGRTDTRALTCAAVKAVVARDRDVVLASSETAYETVHRDNMACASDETGTPAFIPSADEPSCFAGWRCKQRSNDAPK